MGPLPMALTQKCFTLDLIDYYSKWITAKAYANIKDKDAQMFVWKHIVCQFDILKEIVVENGSQFISNKF